MLVILKSNYRYIIVDLLIFLILFLLPSIAHLFPFPIYLIEPMRIAVFIGYLLTKNTYNVAFLAFTIPLFSYLTTGHPLFFKALLISIELATNILLFILFYQKIKLGDFFSIVVSIIVSKLFYYGVKFLFLGFGLLSGPLVSTGLQGQMISVLILSGFFVLLFRNFTKIENNGE
jgi:hypothetical protein